MKWALLIVSLITLAFLFAAALSENVLADWRSYRKEYAGVLKKKATDERGQAIADQFEVRIIQNVVPELGVIDRCITCHTGLDDPRMADQPQPFTTHPGRHIQLHAPSDYGCTICHQGQGRATETVDAHGRDPYWEYPMLEKQYMKSACTRCHKEDDLYRENGLVAQADDASGADSPIAMGKSLADAKGCFGCHAFGGKGGTLGPDLTFEGDKTRHNLDFSHFDKNEPREVEYWLKKHFLDPATVTPDSLMPDFGLSEKEALALTAYVLSFRKKEGNAYNYLPAGKETAPTSGAVLYGRFCSSCHGSDGEGDTVPGIPTPSINNFDTLAVADDNYLRLIINNGRSNTQMPAWGPGAGGLTRSEIERVVDYIRSWEPEGARLIDAKSGLGDPVMGRAYYGLCANCHGQSGEGGIGNALNSETYLAAVSDRFMAENIINGRQGTAMASWKHLPAQAVSDLLAYIRTWQQTPPSYEEVRAKIDTESASENARVGRILFLGNCATCHGREGEGGIGVRLNSPDVIRAVDDRFVYRAITEGRPSTAMPAWYYLSADQVGAIISYMRTWQKGAAFELESPRPTGDYALGEVLYKVSCMRCHGEDARGGVGPQLANPVLLSSASDAVLFHWIGRGRTGSAMMGFLNEEQGPTSLSPDHIVDVIAYLRHAGGREERPILRTGIGNNKLGGQIFAGNCASCHGREGEGASGPQLNNPTFLRTASDGLLLSTIILGRSGTPMQSMVKGQEGLAQIPPDQVQDVISYLRLWDFEQDWIKPRAIAEMSERAINSGRVLFSGNCSGCHGPSGRGVRDGPKYYAPALNNPEFLEAASDGFLLATIARGRSATPMRPFGLGSGGITSLRSDQISDIVSFIRTWSEDHDSQGGLTQ